MLSFNVLWILVSACLSTPVFDDHSTGQVLTLWGLIGIHTDKFGFKNVWEIWYAFPCFACAFPDVGCLIGYIRRSTV